MSKPRKKREKPSQSTPLTPEMRACFDEIVGMIQAARDRMRAIIDDTPLCQDLLNGEAGRAQAQSAQEAVKRPRKKPESRKLPSAKPPRPRKGKKS